MAAGFPHLEVTPATRTLAYECCLTYEVITKRLPALDDLRKGLRSECVMGTSLLDLSQQHPSVKQLVFPEAGEAVEVSELRRLIKYDMTNEDACVSAKGYFDEYLDDLYARGKHVHITTGFIAKRDDNLTICPFLPWSICLGSH